MPNHPNPRGTSIAVTMILAHLKLSPGTPMPSSGPPAFPAIPPATDNAMDIDSVSIGSPLSNAPNPEDNIPADGQTADFRPAPDRTRTDSSTDDSHPRIRGPSPANPPHPPTEPQAPSPVHAPSIEVVIGNRGPATNARPAPPRPRRPRRRPFRGPLVSRVRVLSSGAVLSLPPRGPTHRRGNPTRPLYALNPRGPTPLNAIRFPQGHPATSSSLDFPLDVPTCFAIGGVSRPRAI
uniref:Uncharacterized protein n=1 Tax=Globodera rostochiensis TaxID=31243 RepID=A0A914HNS6_GLORO